MTCVARVKEENKNEGICPAMLSNDLSTAQNVKRIRFEIDHVLTFRALATRTAGVKI